MGILVVLSGILTIFSKLTSKEFLLYEVDRSISEILLTQYNENFSLFSYTICYSNDIEVACLRMKLA